MPFESPTGTGTLALVWSAAPCLSCENLPDGQGTQNSRRTLKLWRTEPELVPFSPKWLLHMFVAGSIPTCSIVQPVISWGGSRCRAGWGILLRNPIQLWKTNESRNPTYSNEHRLSSSTIYFATSNTVSPYFTLHSASDHLDSVIEIGFVTVGSNFVSSSSPLVSR